METQLRRQTQVCFCVLIFSCALAYGRLLTIPALPFTYSPGNKSTSLETISRIIIHPDYSNARDYGGETLIPPTLLQFSETLRDDLEATFGLQIPIQIQPPSDNHPGSLILSINASNPTLLDVAGRKSTEGYTLNITEHTITITGASPLGVWWGTRTLLQAAVLHDGRVPHGYATDTPGWRARGIMLDAARHYYPPEFVIEICSYLSYFKQNQLHLHLSDNMFINYEEYTRQQALGLYSAFRLMSENPLLEGLARLANESYSRDQFEMIQQRCAGRGVTVIPEIEAPAHALAIVQWKPDLGLEDPTMLNLSHPETLPTLQTIWKTFLPWFHCKTIHIGADEYSSEHIPDYTNYVDNLARYVTDMSSKTTRIWATFTPQNGANVSKNVEIQHWAPYEDNPYFDFVQNGYRVLNSDFATYIVPKWSPYFGQTIDKSLVFNGTPGGGGFSPNIFDRRNATNNPPRNHSAITGHIAPLWSDWGRTASTYLEAYYAWRDGLPALADKQWGGDLLESEYDVSFLKLQPGVPAQNLDRKITSKSETVLEYRFKEIENGSDIVEDTSGNGYHGKLYHDCKIRGSILTLSHGCYLETPLSSKGRDYILSFSVKPFSSRPASLFSGGDSALWTGYDGYSNVTMISGGHPYSLNYTLPVNTWTQLELIGTGNSTRLRASTKCGRRDSTHVFNTRIDTGGVQASGGILHVWVPMAFEAPLERVGEGFEGQIKDILLKTSI
ncbi:beta-hexosaminidase [Thozetella sp. PMI_491]|nr:beta-hexosaminidase [Thozetella sp. PMI_491]